MKEYIIHAKVKNNLLLGRIRAQQHTVSSFCRTHGLSISAVGALVNMKKRALLRSGRWSTLATKLADIFLCTEEDLFTEEQRVVQLRTNEAYLEMDRQRALALMSDPSASIEAVETEAVCAALMKALTPREHFVMESRLKGEALEPVAAALDVTRSRIRQIEAKALRKMRALLANDGARLIVRADRA